MADYPALDLEPTNPVNEALRECIAALRCVQPMIALQPRREMFEVIAARAELILTAAELAMTESKDVRVLSPPYRESTRSTDPRSTR